MSKEIEFSEYITNKLPISRNTIKAIEDNSEEQLHKRLIEIKIIHQYKLAETNIGLFTREEISKWPVEKQKLHENPPTATYSGDIHKESIEREIRFILCQLKWYHKINIPLQVAYNLTAEGISEVFFKNKPRTWGDTIELYPVDNPSAECS